VAPPVIKKIIKLRKIILRRYKTLKNPETKQQINELNIDIKSSCCPAYHGHLCVVSDCILVVQHAINNGTRDQLTRLFLLVVVLLVVELN
jgi:hypothetical protein